MQLPEGAVSIGENVWMQKIRAHSSDEWVGIIEWHLNPAGELCAAAMSRSRVSMV